MEGGQESFAGGAPGYVGFELFVDLPVGQSAVWELAAFEGEEIGFGKDGDIRFFGSFGEP